MKLNILKSFRKSEANLKAIIGNSLESIWSIDTKYRIQYANEVFINAFEKSFGTRLEEGVNILDALPDSLRKLWKDRYDRAFNNEHFVFNDKVKLEDRDIYIEVAMNPILMDGKVIGASFYGKDISEQKKHETQLIAAKEKAEENEESFKKLSVAINQSKEIIFITDKEGIITFLNPEFTNVYGYTPEEVLGKTTPRILKSGLLAREVSEYLWSQLLDKKSIKAEYKNKRKDGSLIDIEGSADPILNEKGDIIGFLGVHKDITDRKRAEAEIIAAKEKAEESEKQLRYSQKVARIGYYILDFKTGIWTSSEMLDEIFGIDKEFVRSVESWVDMIHPDFQDDMQNYFANNILKNKEPFNRQYKIINRKTKVSCWVHGLGTFEMDENGELLKMFGTIQDINSNKKTEAELIEAKEKAEESDRLKSAFLANMSHEIRTPMNGILGFAELLKQPDLSGEEQQNFIQIIEESGARMLEIINDIVSISKIESGLIELKLKELNVREQLEYIYNFFKPEVDAKGMKLLCSESSLKKDSIIVTDHEKFLAILTNLVKNAIKYSDQGSVELGYVHKDNCLEFYVKDTGIGIDVSRQEAIFERFVQADIVDKEARQGAGLGLSITKAYVEMLGGEIWVKSDQGKGSVFYFTIPDSTETKAEQAIITENVDDGIETQIDNLKVLIVEDDPTSDYLLSILVKEFSSEVLHAKNGLEAVEICRKNTDIDLVLMDVKMPLMDGYKATDEIRKFNSDVVIVAQSAHGLAGDKEKAIEAGCNAHLSKPIIEKELAELVQQLF